MQRKKPSAKSGYKTVRTLGDITEYVMVRNGLRVLHMPLPGTGTVTSNIVYLVGSRHEARGETGLAHMLEHMLFKPVHDGTGKKMKELKHKVLGDKGALMNATTWLDRTNYFFTVPKQYFSEALAVEASRMRNLIIDEKEFLPERANVLSEYEMYRGVPREVLTAELVQAAFVSHGYGHETIGHKPDIEGYTTAMLTRFYDTYYWPNNAVLTIVGDISAAQALAAVRQQFGAIPPSPQAIVAPHVREPAQGGVRSVSVTRQSPLNLYACAYKVPGLRTKDHAVLSVIAAYLADGPQSRLEKALVDTHRASAVDVSVGPTHDDGLFVVYVQIAAGTTHDEVAAIVDQELQALSAGIPARRLKVLKTKIVAEEQYQRDGTYAITAELTECIAAGDWTRFYTWLDDVEAVSSRDIVRAAHQYFTATNQVTGRFIGTATR